MTYADLAARLDLPPADDPDEQIRLLQERRAEQLDALYPRDNNWWKSAPLVRLRESRLAEVRAIEHTLNAAGAPLEPEGGSE